METTTFLTVWDRESLIEKPNFKNTEYHVSIPCPELRDPTVYFRNFADAEEIEGQITPDFAAVLRDQLPELVDKATEYARQERLISQDAKGGGLFRFSGIRIDKEMPSFFYLGFDAGPNPDEFQEEIYVYIGFDAQMELTSDLFLENIWI